MKVILPIFALLTAASACRATTPADRNALSRHQTLTEMTTAETGDPSHLTGLALLAPPPVKYPVTRKTDFTDTCFGTKVADPYRWLEALDSPETKAWVTAQNEVTFGYLGQIPFRDKIRDRLTKIWNYERYGVPEQVGSELVFSKNDGLQNQAVLYRQRGAGAPQLLLDPNKFSADGTTALAGTEFSNGHRYLAYATSGGGGGSDWHKVRIMDLTTSKLLPEELSWVKVSGTSWTKNGFYYSRYDAPKAGENNLSGKNKFHKVYFHKLNTPQTADKLVYENPKMALGFRMANATEDERFLVLSLTDGKADGNRLQVRDLADPSQAATWTTLIPSYEFNRVVATKLSIIHGNAVN